MAEVYEFTRLGVCPAELTDEINDSSISIACLAVTVDDLDQVTVIMADVIPTQAEETQLESIVMNHVCDGNEQSEVPGEDDPGVGGTVSFAEMSLVYSESQLTNNDWIQIGAASDSDSGVLMPLDGVITKATAHVEHINKATNVSWVDLYINNNKHNNRFIEFGPNSTASNPLDTTHSFGGRNDDDDDNDISNQRRFKIDINIPFNAGDKIRFRTQTPNGSKLYDTVLTVWYKWRTN